MSGSSGPRRILALLRLGNGNASAHLEGLARSPSVQHVEVLRESACAPAPEDAFTWHLYRRSGPLPPLPGIVRRGLDIVRQAKVDVVVSFFLAPYGILGWIIARLTGRPAVTCLVGSDFNRQCRAWYGAPLRMLLRRSDRVTGTGSGMLRQLEAWGVPRERLHRLPHAVDTDRFSSATALPDRRFDLVWVGSLIPLKRVDDLLRACATVARSREGFQAAVVGDGPERERLEKLVSELGLDGHVVFTGYRPDPETFFRDARMVALTSESEGLPFVLVEGMSCGCVPVTTRCGDVADLVRDGENGRTVAVGDHEGLARRILELLEDPIRLGEFSRQSLEVREAYSWESAARAWTEILEGLP